jgi:hypothetical protein
VLYLEGSTDLAILRALAQKLGHPARAALERPFVHYVANQPGQARHHFHGLREAKPDLAGIALYDRLEGALQADPNLAQMTWQRREIESYLCQRSALLGFAEARAREQHGDLFAPAWRKSMEEAIDEIAAALAALGKPDPWSADLKASDEFLDPLFKRFYEKVKLPNLMRKTDYHTLAPFVPEGELDPEVREKLDRIAAVAAQAKPTGGTPT